MISLLFVPITPENTHGCCDGYGWVAVKKDCVGMSIALVILSKKTKTMFSTLSEINNFLLLYRMQFRLHRNRVYSYMSVSFIWERLPATL